MVQQIEPVNLQRVLSIVEVRRDKLQLCQSQEGKITMDYIP